MNNESKLTEGPLGVPVKDDGVLGLPVSKTSGQPGMDTYPPEVDIKPGPLSKKEIKDLFSTHPEYERIMAIANELEVMVGKVQWFVEKLAYRDQQVADMTVQLERAQRDERVVRRQILEYESEVS